jgi:hypothetical protein
MNKTIRQQTRKKIRGISLIIVSLLMSYCSNPVGIAVKETKPEITSTPVTRGIVNEQFIFDVNATGNPAPTYTLTISPSGMIIDNITGNISWIPSTSSDFTVPVTVKVTNKLGTSSQTFVIRIGGLQIEGWETSIFSMVNIEQAKIDSLLTLRQNGSYPKIHSIIVIKNGKLILEEYFRGIPYHWPFYYG